MGSDTIKRLSYAEFLGELKERIRIAQTKAVLLANKELISIYWDIGKHIVEGQKESDPIGVSGYRLTTRLPDGLRGQLPSPQELDGVLEEVGGEMGGVKGLWGMGMVCEVGGESLETEEIYAYVCTIGVGRMESPIGFGLSGKEKV